VRIAPHLKPVVLKLGGVVLHGTNPVTTRFLPSGRRIYGDSAQRNGLVMFGAPRLSPHIYPDAL
jgi:hypothetical protein